MTHRYDQLKVLVVDDSMHMRVLVSAILSGAGVVDIVQAVNGDDAWAKMLATEFDIVFADWGMSPMSGLELTKKIRNAEDSPNPFIPVVMLTGHTTPERLHAARDAGVHEFLTKPVVTKPLMECLDRIIEEPRAFVRTETYFGPCRRRADSAGYRGPERRLSRQMDAALEIKPVQAA